MNIIAWVVLGLIAGAIAKAIYPGYQGGGILGTMILGIVGALVGGFVGSALLGISFTGFTLQGFLVAIAGACLLLFLFGLLTRRSAL
ncbi:GlsB/YeaQ/YmgE family stress response membrane protein [Leptolyngbya sp. FACHB-261]|uniref:GlsB/YeaQ/YmgE family stress response membrane protein n=1 Tax=Leptolyngbya sp. FACHB-261 TaxID=2692806 RepID=UPI00168234A5|nr:GlsB/YeaQ/YmgE family stress response membrane protein [Leptolyngbya sp. FACHB-261]MBD2101368.1 GlsB/YeaQ/YmgE family stress response membrane protein [Leptolyngbya sp. FACHB-261]